MRKHVKHTANKQTKQQKNTTISNTTNTKINNNKHNIKHNNKRNNKQTHTISEHTAILNRCSYAAKALLDMCWWMMVVVKDGWVRVGG